jgi:copper transport protein
MRRARIMVVSLATAGIMCTFPAVAMAHAGLVSSTPEPGAELGTGPGVVVLRFAEPLNVRLSRASVTTPDGATLDGKVTSSQQISVDLSTNAQGIYEVGWMTVSLLDGHTLAGSFAFGVGVPVGPGAIGGTSTSPRTTDLLIALARLVEDVTLLLAVGLLLLGRLANREPPIRGLRTSPDVAIGVALAGGAAVVLGEALAAAHGLSPGGVVSYLTTGLPGIARLARPVLELVALVLALRSSRWTVVPIAAAIVALAAAGHAAAVDPPWWGIAVEAVHVGGAALWAGGVLALARQRPLAGWKGEGGRELLDRFTPVALVAFGATAVAGLLRGVQEVGSVHALVATSYGATLLVKTVLVLAMVQLSVFAWRRLFVKPRLEAGVAVAVVVAAVLLAAYPLPPARLSEAEAAEAIPPAASTSALPHPGDLTMGAHAGEFLIGLTIRPSSDASLVYVHGLGSDADAGARTVDVTVDGLPVDVSVCGDTCRRVSTSLREGAQVDVMVEGANGGTARFIVPSLGSPPAEALVSKMNVRIHALDTYRLDETLMSGLATVRSRYNFAAPNAFEGHTVDPDGSGSRVVWIGDTRYLRSLPGGSWKIDRGASPTVPIFVWDSFTPYIDARLVGRSVIDGVRTDIVIFFGGDPTLPVWFRLWIDRTGLVHKGEMRALGHFMDHRYDAFDRPIVIHPPAIGAGTAGTGG